VETTKSLDKKTVSEAIRGKTIIGKQMRFRMRLLALICLIATGAPMAEGGMLDDAIRDIQRLPLRAPVQPETKVWVGTEPNKSNVPSPSEERPQSVPIEAFPWAAAITMGDAGGPGAFCGGVVIDDQWVLTAAHCVEQAQKTGALQVVVGSTYLAKPTRRLMVADIKVHPDWKAGTYVNDFALLRVSGGGGPLSKISLDGPPVEAQVGSIGQVVGWGVSNLNQPPSDELKLIPSRVIARQVCNGPANYAGRVEPAQFCAQSLLWNFDVCQGFGGSGFILTDQGGQRYLGGLVSWGEGCPPSGRKPAVYSDVSSQRAWIRATIGAGR
jgi:hypothetical protein